MTSSVCLALCLLSIIYGCFGLVFGQSNENNHCPSQSLFVDSATFKLYQKGTLVGTAVNSMDMQGHYKRTFELSMAGQNIAYEMVITPDVNGYWKTMTITNPSFGDFQVTREAGQVEILHKGETKHVDLPEDYILFDDFGFIFESAMLKRYDMKRGGKQTFTRFRIPESFPGNVIETEVEYAGTEIRSIQGSDRTFFVFKVKSFGALGYYWTDPELRVYLTEAPAEQVAAVRVGYEELLAVKETDPLLSKPEFDLRKETVMIPMRDDVRLSTDLYFPVSEHEAFPVILIRTPYKKEMNELDGKYYAQRGYVTAIQDVRGRFGSEGEWEPVIHEAFDGYDTIEWLASQGWSSGKIGMIGASYLGWVQLLAAAQRPPHLTTIIPNVPPSDPFYNLPYEYGSFFVLGALWWAEVVETEATAELSQKTFFEISDRAYEKELTHLPVIDLDKRILGRKNAYWRNWIRHNRRDSYWESGCYQEKLEKLDIPVFLQSGWFDGDGIGAKLAYLHLKKSKNKYIKLILGPWGHTAQGSSSYQGKDMGDAAAVDLQKLYLRWFDCWLKGIDNRIIEEPLVQMYALNSQKWLKADTYPLPQTEFTKLYLTSREGANTLKGDGRLSWEIIRDGRDCDTYTYDPGSPTPAWQFRFKDKGRKGYEAITGSRQDILVYETEPFDQPLTIAGPVSARLYAASSARDTDWFVTFQAISDKDEVIPLGNPWGRGTIRARYRNSMRQPELLEKDRIYGYTIDLWHTGITFEKGWRIRVEVTSAFFPFFSRNLNTGGHNEMETRYLKAEQKIYHSKEYPSHLLLPVVNVDPDAEKAANETESKGQDSGDRRQKTDQRTEPAEFSERETRVRIEPGVLDSYAGQYQVRPNVSFSITHEEGHLMIQPPGEPKEKLLPLSESEFRSAKVDAALNFCKNKEGRVTHFVLHQGGYQFQARNLAIPWPEPLDKSKEVSVNPEIFTDFLGEYTLSDNQVITVSSQGDSLFAQITGQIKVKIFPASEETYFYRVADAEITFFRNDEGRVTHLVLHQNGVYLQADKRTE
jgi:putative CocE/NonD family hydrolase